MGVILRFLKELEDELEQNTDPIQPIYLTVNGNVHIGDNFYCAKKDCAEAMDEGKGVNEH